MHFYLHRMSIPANANTTRSKIVPPFRNIAILVYSLLRWTQQLQQTKIKKNALTHIFLECKGKKYLNHLNKFVI